MSFGLQLLIVSIVLFLYGQLSNSRFWKGKEVECSWVDYVVQKEEVKECCTKLQQDFTSLKLKVSLQESLALLQEKALIVNRMLLKHSSQSRQHDLLFADFNDAHARYCKQTLQWIYLNTTKE